MKMILVKQENHRQEEKRGLERDRGVKRNRVSGGRCVSIREKESREKYYIVYILYILYIMDRQSLMRKMLKLQEKVKIFKDECEKKKDPLEGNLNTMPPDEFEQLYRETMVFLSKNSDDIDNIVAEIGDVDNFDTDTGNNFIINTFNSTNALSHFLYSAKIELARFNNQNFDRAHNHPSGVPQPPISIGSATFPRKKLLNMLEETILMCKLIIANIDTLIKHINPHNPQVVSNTSSQLAAEAHEAHAALVRWQKSRYAPMMAQAKGVATNRGKKKSLDQRKTLKKKSPRRSHRKSHRKKPKTKHRKKRVLQKTKRR